MNLRYKTINQFAVRTMIIWKKYLVDKSSCNNVFSGIGYCISFFFFWENMENSLKFINLNCDNFNTFKGKFNNIFDFTCFLILFQKLDIVNLATLVCLLVCIFRCSALTYIFFFLLAIFLTYGFKWPLIPQPLISIQTYIIFTCQGL